ncbi:MAG TPA: hypothetical protein PLD51_08165 [Pontiellaceae bacterium]|nr:hypothetical protein [Pontiellaceae bacterium]HPR83817.1 hypothetical protein [Pontiellaceae bacterium]
MKASCYLTPMSADPFHLNRPVHLARRDVFFEKAVARIRKLKNQDQPAEQCKTAEEALFLLLEARLCAEAANLSEKTSTQNRLFMDFMDTAVDNTRSITSLLRRQISVNVPHNPLDLFLGSGDTGSKMSGHYRRCAAHILKGLLLILQKAEKPFRDLRQTSVAKMTAEDKIRYEKAYSHFEELADSEAEKAVAEAL